MPGKRKRGNRNGDCNVEWFVSNGEVVPPNEGSNYTHIRVEGTAFVKSTAFKACHNLRHVELCEGIIQIGRDAFKGCQHLESVVTPSTLQSIGNGAFHNCKKLSGMELREGVNEIGKEAFKGCESLKNIVLPSTLTSISDSTFMCCKNLENVELHEGVTDLHEGAFKHCESLKNITLPVNLQELSEEVFMGCKALSSMRVPLRISSLSSKLFHGCKSLKRVQLHTGVKSIGVSALSGCSSLQKIRLPRNIRKIHIEAFSQCTSLQCIKIPFRVDRINHRVFADCTSLKKIEFESPLDWLRATGREALANDVEARLTSIQDPHELSTLRWRQNLNPHENLNHRWRKFQNQLLTIGQGAFLRCKALEEIGIPSSVFRIEHGCFSGCQQLKKVKLSSNPIIGEGTFAICPNLEYSNILSDCRMTFNTFQHFSKDIASCCIYRMNSDHQADRKKFILKMLRAIPDEIVDYPDGSSHGRIPQQMQDKSKHWITYWDRMDATTNLELAIWKINLINGMDEDRESRLRIREGCGRDMKVIIDGVMEFLGYGYVRDVGTI
mmetsp:Transcript_6322/g.11267  ORF Transcript_6322/g.11267 Transcript_6322/m.11267 type:complete len:552 (-) Transcript_6322:211-1866(-)